MRYEILYPDRDQERGLSRVAALKEVREFATHGGIDYMKVVDKQLAGEGFDESPRIGIHQILITPTDEDYDDWIYVQSDEFLSEEDVFEFVREAGLIHLLGTGSRSV
ncbi:MAG: hypothetical protein JWM39_674 [Parcubacteria group bacterium]|nr:hypothetical protein [Parcubacteria group bacterium]